MENDADKELVIGVMAPVTMESGKKDSDTVKVFSFQKKKLVTTECGPMITDTAQANCFTLRVATESKELGNSTD